MTMASKRIRPDFSEFVAHFTANRKPYGGKSQTVGSNTISIEGNAKQRLHGILQSKKIIATTMPHTDQVAVCFTECTWGSLLDHAKEYSAYGIGFTKEFLFHKGGGPAVYIRADLWKKQLKNKGFHPELFPFLTPFRPNYASKQHQADYWDGKKSIDYSHEREWRAIADVQFEFGDVQFVVVREVGDIDDLPQDAVKAIGKDRFIAMDVYRKVEQLWPTHLVP